MYLAGVIMHTVSLFFSLINHWRRRAGSFRECLDAPGGVMERVWGEDWAEGEGITSYDRSREGRRRHSNWNSNSIGSDGGWTSSHEDGTWVGVR